MKTTPLLALAIAACIVFCPAGAFAQKTAGQHVDDSTLATSTKSALAGIDLGAAGAINVEVYKGTVQLAGFVDTDEDRAEAIEAARGVSGATNVLDAMVVMSGKRSAGRTFDDSAIQTRLKAGLTERLGVDVAFEINTEIRKGEVILSGFVADDQTRVQAGEIAGAVKGVGAVHNHLAIKH